MEHTQIVRLVVEGVVYYSDNDEAAFFEWLSKMNCIVKVGGEFRELHLMVQIDLVDRNNLLDIIALFYRYKMDIKQILKLDRPEFSSWLHDAQTYWFADMFG